MIAEFTATILLVTLTAHLVHHRLVMRPISHVEGAAALALWIPGLVPLPEHVWGGVHVVLAAMLAVGSVRLVWPPTSETSAAGLRCRAR